MKTNYLKKKPARSHIVSLRVPDDMMYQLKRHADMSNVPISEYIRRSIKMSFTNNNSDIISHSAKALIKDDFLLRMLSFVIGSSLAQTVNFTDRERAGKSKSSRI